MGYNKFQGQGDLGEEFWNGVRTDAPEPLEPGLYECECIKADAEPIKNGKNAGKPSIKAVFKITGKWGDDEDLSRTVYDNFVFIKEGAFKMKNFCEAADVALPMSTYEDELNRVCEDMLGIELWCELSLRKYEGKRNNNISRYISDADIDAYAKQLEEGSRGTGEAPKKKSRAERAAARAQPQEPQKERRRRGSSSANGAAEAAPETEDLDDGDEAEEPEAPAAAPPADDNPRRVNRRRRGASS
jgi:hypothetical protein